MVNGKKVAVVMPAYNAEKTLEKTYAEIPRDIVDIVILTDDCSRDNTIQKAKELGIEEILVHERNKGYGGNQKTCYNRALELGADIVVMLHPDYQYTPKLIHSMVYVIAEGVYPVVLASRILGKGALKGGMPLIKYVANRCLTLVQNMLLRQKLSEYHTGYRAFSRELLESLDLSGNSDDFIFDNEMLVQIAWSGAIIAEVSCPTRYFPEASSINFRRSAVYGLGCLHAGLRYRLARWNLLPWKKLPPERRGLMKGSRNGETP